MPKKFNPGERVAFDDFAKRSGAKCKYELLIGAAIFFVSVKFQKMADLRKVSAHAHSKKAEASPESSAQRERLGSRWQQFLGISGKEKSR